jgi:hypothetical protein
MKPNKFILTRSYVYILLLSIAAFMYGCVGNGATTPSRSYQSSVIKLGNLNAINRDNLNLWNEYFRQRNAGELWNHFFNNPSMFSLRSGTSSKNIEAYNNVYLNLSMLTDGPLIEGIQVEEVANEVVAGIIHYLVLHHKEEVYNLVINGEQAAEFQENIIDKRLSNLSPEIVMLTNLQSLNLSHNNLSELPFTVSGLTKLESINLSDNQFSELLTLLCKLTNLKRLDISDNKFRKLPASMSTWLNGLDRINLNNNNWIEREDLEEVNSNIDKDTLKDFTYKYAAKKMAMKDLHTLIIWNLRNYSNIFTPEILADYFSSTNIGDFITPEREIFIDEHYKSSKGIMFFQTLKPLGDNTHIPFYFNYRIYNDQEFKEKLDQLDVDQFYWEAI